MFKLLKKATMNNLSNKVRESLSSAKSEKSRTPIDNSSMTLKNSSDSLQKSSSLLDEPSNSSLQRQDSHESPSGGQLSVKVIEGRHLRLPLEFVGNSRIDQQRLPYIVIEFDKNETVSHAKDYNRDTGAIQWTNRANFDVSRDSEVMVSVYQKGDEKDILVGTARFMPHFSDQKTQEECLELRLDSSGKNGARSEAAGEIYLQATYKKSGKKSLTIEEFDLLKVIGKGSFGKVMQVRKKDTGRIYAMKILKKSHIVERDEVSHTLAERTVLAKINHPFIVPIKFSFQNPEKLYLVLAFVNGGELFHHLQREGRFDEDRARFYTAELLCALECLHSYNIIYRDLKPENILLDYSGHIALCDFGLCKLNMKDGNKTNTFCGTPEYLAPEILMGDGYTKAVDWWTLGILLYEMLTGLPPFYDEDQDIMYKKIMKDALTFPDIVGRDAKDLLRKMLDRDPEDRLGSNGADEIKRHPFFDDIDWKKLMARKYSPSFKPNVSSATDTSNFDEEFTSEPATDSYVGNSRLTDREQNQFDGFSYRGDTAMGSMQPGSYMGANARFGSLAGSFRGPSNRRS